jgi:hypothetical protein
MAEPCDAAADEMAKMAEPYDDICDGGTKGKGNGKNYKGKKGKGKGWPKGEFWAFSDEALQALGDQQPMGTNTFTPTVHPPPVRDPARALYLESLKQWLRNNLMVVEMEELLSWAAQVC